VNKPYLDDCHAEIGRLRKLIAALDTANRTLWEALDVIATKNPTCPSDIATAALEAEADVMSRSVADKVEQVAAKGEDA